MLVLVLLIFIVPHHGYGLAPHQRLTTILHWMAGTRCIQLVPPAATGLDSLFADYYTNLTTNSSRTVFLQSADNLQSQRITDSFGFGVLNSATASAHRACQQYVAFAADASNLEPLFSDDKGHIRFTPITGIMILSPNEPTAWTGAQLRYIEANALAVFWLQQLDGVIEAMWPIANSQQLRKHNFSTAESLLAVLEAHRNVVLVNDNAVDGRSRQPFRISYINCPPYVKVTRSGENMLERTNLILNVGFVT